MMRKISILCLLGCLAGTMLAQEKETKAESTDASKTEKVRPPRIPDAPFVPKRGMIQREKGQFWAGPPDEGRFAQILSLTLVPREKLQEKLAEWPNFQELSPEQRERLLERIDQVRETAQRQALEVAKEFNLQIASGQEEEFVRMYWSERVAMDQALKKEFQEKRKRLEEDSENRILRKFPKTTPKP